MDELKYDSFRRDHPFSSEMKNFQERMFAPALTRAEKADVLIEWLSSTNYPCLFGRKAAKASSVSVLILEERDLFRADKEIEGLIRDARSEWREQARTGRKHALVILAVSERLAFAEPDATVLEITRRLCEMYLGRSARADVVYRDELFLEIDAESPLRIRWEVGVDNFAAQADGRWWHDHRIPGGIGFSMNSVGHMVRTMVEQALEKSPDLRAKTRRLTREKLIQFALPMAMRTILFAQQKSSCPGTRLRPRSIDSPATIAEEELSRASAMKGILDWDENCYEGWYHTDHSFRSESFDPNSRPRTEPWELDFSYLHAETELDYAMMSIGEEILAILGIG